MVFASISAQNLFCSSFCAYDASVYKHHIHVVNQTTKSSTNDGEMLIYQTISKKIVLELYKLSFLRNNQQMQLYAVNFIPLLGSIYMFRVFYTPIIRSTIFNCIYSHWYITLVSFQLQLRRYNCLYQ
jgi:hypothetical protein